MKIPETGFRQNPCFGIYETKSTQIWPEVRFFKFLGKLKYDTFLIFCMKLQHHKGSKLLF